MKNFKLLIIVTLDTYKNYCNYGLVNPENGEVLYNHICTSKSFALDDLWGSRKERQVEIRKKYSGYSEIVVDFIEDTKFTKLEINKKIKDYIKKK